ncbi:MAG: pyrroline-5-carboxylate reductase [Desulfonauticus sp.]|nr:pyrroline-5-carboxylate reductase [Desulfonauticus sp.]
MSSTLGIIGTGNMGKALLTGLSPLENLTIYAYDLDSAKLNSLAQAGLCTPVDSPQKLAQKTDYIILAVKPYLIVPLIQEILPVLNEQKRIISIAAGVKLDTILTACKQRSICIRIMPNTPALIGKGVFALCFDDKRIQEEDKQFIQKIFSQLGSIYILPEQYFDAFTALIGSGPAFVFLILEAFIQAGITLGFDQKTTKKMVLELFTGSIKLCETLSEQHLAQLKDMVTSPAGTTIAGLNQMEFNGLKKAIIQGILAAYQRSQEL